MKVTINPVGSIINATTAETNIDDNFEAIQDAIEITLSRDGTSPNQMEDTLDMNSNQIINLPTPSSNYSPVRVIDLANLDTGGTINVSSLPVGGSAGQVLSKNSGTDFDASWSSTHYLPAGGTVGQNLVKNSNTDYDASWSNTLSPGGSPNDIQYNANGSFGGLSLNNGQVLSGITGATPQAVYPAMVNVVTAFAIDNTGVTVVGSALQNAINTITAADCIVYIPEGIYNMGSLSLSIPSYSTIQCHNNAVIRRTSDPYPYVDYTSAMVYMTGTRSTWIGGTLENNVVLATSTTSNTINGSNKTFTTQAGLPLVPGSSFVRIWSASHPEARFEQVVSAYTGTSLTINSPFFAGSGTYTDWNIGFGQVFQAAMCLHATSYCVVQGAKATGNWYVGFIMDGWNPPSGGSLICKANVFKNCIGEGIQNRTFYMYGNCYDNIFDGCFADGNNIFPGATDYGFNFNPANPSGSFNTHQRNKIVNCRSDAIYAQGFGYGDQVYYMSIENCTASNMTGTPSVGFLATFGNGTIPQFNKFHNCIAQSCTNGYQLIGLVYFNATGCSAVACGTGFTVGPSGANQAQYVHVSDCQALGCTGNGFVVEGNSIRTDVVDCVAVSNAGTGITIGSGAVTTLVIGSRSFGNTVANFSDGGTGTVGTPTTT